MEKITIVEMAQLAEMMFANSANGYDSVAVLYYEDAQELVKELLDVDPTIVSCELSSPEIDGYYDEYYVTLTSINEIFVEHAKNKDEEKGYLSCDMDVMYIDGGAHASILRRATASELYELTILRDNEDDEDDNEDWVDEQNDDEDKDVPFAVSADEMKTAARRIANYTQKDIIDFIKRRFPEDCEWSTGNCYYFTLILNDRFPGGHIYYDVVVGHFVFEYGGVYYDYNGVIKNVKEDDCVLWSDFINYDAFQMARIFRDCIA